MYFNLTEDETFVMCCSTFCICQPVTYFAFFRCGIPVVLMGDTGCGKTHLIQYMCDLMLLGNGLDRENTKNLFILKVTNKQYFTHTYTTISCSKKKVSILRQCWIFVLV